MAAPPINDDSTFDYIDSYESEQQLRESDETFDALDELETSGGGPFAEPATAEATPESVGEWNPFAQPAAEIAAGERRAAGDRQADVGLSGLVTGEKKPKGQGAASAIASGAAQTGLNLVDTARFLASPVLPDDLNESARSAINDQRKLMSSFYGDADATTAESLARGGVQLGLSFLLTGGVAGRVAGGAANLLGGAPRIASAVGNAIRYGVPGEIAFNPYDPRLSNYFGINVLAANPDDPEIVARTKSAVEGGVVGKVAGTAISVLGRMGRHAAKAWSENASKTERFAEGYTGESVPSYVRDQGDEVLPEGTPLDPAAMRGSRAEIPTSPYALLPERIASGADQIVEGKVPHDILMSAQDANYARAFAKDLEEAVVMLPKGASDLERAKVLAAQTKIARNEAKEVSRAARAKWDELQGDPRFSQLPDAARLELRALAEGGEPTVRFERVEVPEQPIAEAAAPAQWFALEKGGIRPIDREAARGAGFPIVEMQYNGKLTDGTPSYTVHMMLGEGQEKALLRLRSAFRKAHPTATEVDIRAVPADSRGVTQRLFGIDDAAEAMQRKRFPLRKSAPPAVFRRPETPPDVALNDYLDDVTDQLRSDTDFSVMDAEDVLDLIDEYTTGAETYALRDADGDLENAFALLESNQAAAGRATAKDLATRRSEGVAAAAAGLTPEQMRAAVSTSIHQQVHVAVGREVAAQTQAAANVVQTGGATAAEEMRFVQLVRTTAAVSDDVLPPAPKPTRARSSGATTTPLASHEAAVASVTGGGGSKELRALAKELNATESSLPALRRRITAWASGLESGLREFGERRFPRLRKVEKSLQEWYGNSLLYDIETTAKNLVSNTHLFASDQIQESLRAFWRGVGQGNVAEETVIEAIARSRGAARQVYQTTQATIAAFRNSADDLAKVRSTVARESGERVKRAFETEQTQLGESGVNVLPPHIQVPYLGTAIRVPRRINTTVDEFSKGINYATETAVEGYRVGYRKGLRGSALDDFADSYHEIADPVTRQRVADRALAKANRNVFVEPLGPLGKVGEALLEALPFGRVLVPFYRVPINIAKMSFRMDPIGAMVRDAMAEDSALRALVQTQDWRRVLQTPEGQDLASRLTMGAGIWATAGALVSAGRITGAAPSDPRDRQMWNDAGMKEYAIKVGDRWIPGAFIGPFAMTLFVAADAWTALDEVSERSPEAAENMVATLALGYAKALKNLNYAQGVYRLLDAVQDPERNFLGTAGRIAGGFIPSFVERIPERLDLFTPFNVDGAVKDPRHYKATGDLDRVRTATNQFILEAGLAGPAGLPPKFTLFGPKIRRPFGIEQERANPIAKEMVRLGMGVDFDRRLRTIMGYTLSPDEFRDFGYFVNDFKLGGNTLVEQLDSAVTSPQWAQLTDGNPAAGMIGSRHQYIGQVLDTYLGAAEKVFLAGRPDVAQKMATLYRENLRVKTSDAPPDSTNATLKALLEGTDR